MTDILDDLDAEQRAAATAVVGPVCIVAGAGTGKTRTVTHRLAHGIESGAVDAQRALAITHSRKAAGELGERLHRLGVGSVDARTFHSAGLRVAKLYWSLTGRRESAPDVLADGESWRLWRDSLRAVTGAEPDRAMMSDVVEEVGWARSRLVEREDYPAAAQLAGRDPGVDLATIVTCWERYCRTKDRLGRVDFADLLELAAGLLERESSVADTVRRRWSHVTVDEYQDTDPAQQRLLDAVVGAGQDICVVGDPRQAIYSWKGADPTYLTRFTKRYPDARTFDLTRNYRSSSQILEWANPLARQRGTKPLVATQPPGPRPKVTQLDHEAAEAAWVVGATRKALAAGTLISEIAVLYRYNATQARFEAAYARAGMATVVADDGTFFERDEIRAVLVPFGQAARAEPDRDGIELLTSLLTRASFDRQTPPPGLGAARARWESQLALLELIETSDTGGSANAGALLSEINLLASRTHGPRSEGVTLATLHRAKGLEWDVVFVVGVTDGAIPSSYATTEQQLAEEERLLYVGVTRARRELHLTWSATNGRGWTNRPSPLLALLPTQEPGARAGGAARLGGGKRSGRGGPSGATRRSGGPRRLPPSAAHESAGSSAACPHCADPLKGMAARRLGVCSNCVTGAPGDIGRRARNLVQIVAEAATATGLTAEQLVSEAGLMRLLDRRPKTAQEVADIAGVNLTTEWARAAAEAIAR